MTLREPIAQDDEPAEPYLVDFHECKPDENWQYFRRCYACGTTWYSNHCRCEGPRSCGCNRR